MVEKKTGCTWVRFEFKGSPGSQVFLAGTFNDWNPRQAKLNDKKRDGTYTTRLLLAPGKHEYKFVVDGNWCADPTCSDFSSDGHGSVNSVVNIR